MNLDQLKQEAAAKALTYVEDGMVLGLGSGSTAAHFVRLLGKRVEEGLTVRGVPTSEATARLAEQCGVALTTLDNDPHLDICIDGADEFDPALQLTKGGGGALLREKIVAGAAAKFIVICDKTKQVAALGAFALPVEIIRFAKAPVTAALAALGGNPALRMTDGAPYLTDEGNYILDCAFGSIETPRELARKLDRIPGVVDHGLFIDMASLVIIAAPGGIETIDIEDLP